MGPPGGGFRRGSSASTRSSARGRDGACHPPGGSVHRPRRGHAIAAAGRARCSPCRLRLAWRPISISSPNSGAEPTPFCFPAPRPLIPASRHLYPRSGRRFPTPARRIARVRHDPDGRYAANPSSGCELEALDDGNASRREARLQRSTRRAGVRAFGDGTGGLHDDLMAVRRPRACRGEAAELPGLDADGGPGGLRNAVFHERLQPGGVDVGPHIDQ